MAQDIVPFAIAVPDAELESLKNKLSNVTFPSESEFANDWSYGTPLSDLKRLTEYWRDGFDWRAHEAKLNQIPQFTTKIAADGFDELNIHFIHQRSSRPGSIPLLFVHGWPGSFLEATKIVKLLAEPKDENAPSFHVVAPSLPNFGFSDKVTQKGFSVHQYAETMHKLMLKLGYDKYVTQGGDWGFLITRYITSTYPQHCLAAHTNCVVVKTPLLSGLWAAVRYYLGLLSEEEKQGFARTAWYMKDNAGYMVMQATKPNTLGFALADSPVAVLAWIYDKLHDWTDAYPWTDDEILEWISIYQFSKAGAASSVVIYYEIIKMQTSTASKMMEYIPNVPLGLSWFPKELTIPPRAWGKLLGPVVFEGSHQKGGHFAAYECPEELVGDLREMFGRAGGAFKVAEAFKST
ncbi:alpha/beta-hydrolase [Trichoderma citrinoviride]|uniref:Alpha/beta-hydrolase n=1 Tax=Trichoderma citrinoviride TaxID=58853 RepID=A0A2T4AZX2_9HYPO|nr:alpha/beta-hydrolase [Trichoderma citrinoviride]PTB62613.1 alpha/beta-hydrolase [Trichoderma citrinoviride]